MQDFNATAQKPDKAIAKEAMEIHRNGYWQSAMIILDNALKERDESAVLWEVKGKIHKDRYQDDKAITAFAKAFALDPADKFIVMSYGGMLTKTGRHEDAEKIYLTMFEEQKYDVRYLTALGHTYQCMENFEFAAACFGKATTLNRYDGFAFKRMAEIEEKHGFAYTQESWNDMVETIRTKIKDLPNAIAALQVNGPS